MSVEKYSVSNKDFFKDRPYYKELPKHMLLIPDGNRRFARGHDLTDAEVYDKAEEVCKDFIEVAMNEFGAQTVSIFFLRPSTFDRQARTTENLRTIFDNIHKLGKRFLDGTIDVDVSDTHVSAVTYAGKPWMEKPARVAEEEVLSMEWDKLTETMQALEQKTKQGKKKVLFLLNYSGFAELEHAIRTKKLQISDQIGLAIRTGDGMRLSDCPLYSLREAHFSLIQKYLPAIDKDDFRKVIATYYQSKVDTQ